MLLPFGHLQRKKKLQKRQWDREVKQSEITADEHDTLSHESATSYRALAARSDCLSQDRVDASYASKELCRDFSVPSIRSWSRLKRLVRYLKQAPRLVLNYPWQKPTGLINACVDTDFAGCRVTRRSTSGGVLMNGAHCIRHRPATHPTIALSSGEAELGGMCKGASQLIGMKRISHDLWL